MTAGPRDRARDLHLIPADVIEAARRAPSPALAREIVARAVEPVPHAQLSQFVTDVIEQQGDAATWRRGGLLFPMWDLRELATLGVAVLLAPLEPAPDEAWLRLPPDPAWWRRGFEGTGAPAVSRPALTHRWVAPAHVARQYDPRSEAVGDVVAATRRWIALRLARVEAGATPRPSGAVRSGLSLEALWLGAVPGLAATELSDDARRAATALLRERDELPPDADAVPGFRGPEVWYQG